MIVTMLIGIGVLAALGLILGFILAYSSEKLYVEIDTRIEDVNAMLPGVNCGACGYPGCGGFADAIVGGKVTNYKECKPLSKDSFDRITEYFKNQPKEEKAE